MILVNDFLITVHKNATSGDLFYMVSRRSNPNDQGESFDSLDDAICALIAKFQAHLLLKSDEIEKSIKAQSHTVLRLTATTRPNISY